MAVSGFGLVGRAVSLVGVVSEMVVVLVVGRRRACAGSLGRAARPNVGVGGVAGREIS